MSTLRIEKQLADSSISLTKSTLASRGATDLDISRMVTGLVTVNGNNLVPKSRQRKAEDSFPRGFNRPRLIIHTLV